MADTGSGKLKIAVNHKKETLFNLSAQYLLDFIRIKIILVELEADFGDDTGEIAFGDDAGDVAFGDEDGELLLIGERAVGGANDGDEFGDDVERGAGIDF
ncbi:hypothetical protein GCK72_001807 [Caenorhabditis remanei]|uniref:Uncharacterized protein n=1 Tax=Caenorhabditis remanei TaxID=31234 RepID=A0A6A5HP36_CAERE|nr:hypothetical protein GCK72_001807 [Caenorhabditis remanei]KAF1769990.1 hypothetical protein GCK72_001807 [Caenorhabditis remanei]